MSRKFEHKVETARIIPRRYPKGTILNRAGQPVKAIAAPAGGLALDSRLDRVNAWLEGYNPLRGLTISRAVSLLEDFELGRMTLVQYAFYFAEKTDPDAIGLLDLRLSRLLEMDYNVQTEEDADKGLADEQQQFIAERLAYIDNLYDAIEHLAMASFRGYSHSEKWVDQTGEIYHLETVDQWNVIRDGLRGAWRYNPKAANVDYQSLGAEADMPLDRFLFREVRRPINRYALPKFVRQNLSDKDWDAFNEIYNVPGGVVIGPPEIPEGEESEYEAAARKIATGGSGYLPNGSEYTPNEMPHDPSTFEKRLKYLSEKHILAGTGGKLTMLTDATGLGSGASEAHDRVFQSIAAGDARRISEIINRQLVQPWLEAKFPGQEQVAYFQLAANEETDTGDAVDQVSKLSIAGYQVDPDQVTEKTGWKVQLKPQPAALPPGPGADTMAAAGAAKEPKVKNRAGMAAATVVFDRNATRDLTAAQVAAVGPLLDRIATLKAVPADGLAAWLEKFHQDLPSLYAAATAEAPDVALVWTDILSTAFADGMADRPEAPKTVANRKSRPEAQKPAQKRLGVSRPRRGVVRPS